MSLTYCSQICVSEGFSSVKIIHLLTCVAYQEAKCVMVAGLRQICEQKMISFCVHRYKSLMFDFDQWKLGAKASLALTFFFLKYFCKSFVESLLNCLHCYWRRFILYRDHSIFLVSSSNRRSNHCLKCVFGTVFLLNVTALCETTLEQTSAWR